MLRVLRHYLPLRRALLIASETVLLTVVLAVGMTSHLFSPERSVISRLAQEGLGHGDAVTRCLISAFLLAVLAQVAIAFNELYDFRVSKSRYDRAARFVGSSGSAVAVALGSVVLANVWHLQRVLDFPGLALSRLVQTLVFTMLFAFALLYLWRHLFHFGLLKWNFNDRVLILGAGPQARSLAAEMLERSDAGYEAVGMLPEATLPQRGGVDDGGEGAGGGAYERGNGAGRLSLTNGNGNGHDRRRRAATVLLEPIPATAALDDHDEPAAEARELQESLFDLVQRLRIDMVVVALEDRRGALPTEDLLRCRLDGIAVKEREAIYEHITGKIAVEAMRPSYLIFNDGFGRSPKSELAKRAADLVFSCVGVLVTWPLMLATAIAVRFDSAGPVLFRQERVGRDGKPFTVLKFRSMRSDAEAQSGPVWASTDDPRITRCGRFLRRTRLDELPQLFNVLAGDMSLVGPRPERQVFVEDLSSKIPYYRQRHIVKPGITGWAQINYPYGNTVEDALQKLQYDLFYIKYQSLLFDLSILFNTIKTVVLRKGT